MHTFNCFLCDNTKHPIKLVNIYLYVLSSAAMKLVYSSKLVTSLLLVAFLMTSVGTLLGYAWCVGDDGHVEVSYATGSGCCDDGHELSSAIQYDTPSLSQASDDHCGLCLDFTAQQSDAVFFKRFKKTLTIPVETLSSNNSSLSIIYSTKLVVDAPLPQPPPRIAQFLLVHRTVVLLN